MTHVSDVFWWDSVSVMAAEADYLHLVEDIICLIIRRLWDRKQHLSD